MMDRPKTIPYERAIQAPKERSRISVLHRIIIAQEIGISNTYRGFLQEFLCGKV